MQASEVRDESLRQILGNGRWALFLLVLGGIWLHAADSLVVATVMPAVVKDLGGIAWTPWAFALYELGAIVAGALGGYASLRLGLGRGLAFFAFLFAVGCLASAAAPDMAVLLGGRLLQGVGGGALLALSHVAITRGYAEHHWKLLFALVSAVWGLASLAGPLIGGLFAEGGWWRGAFLIFAAKGLLVGAAAPWLLRRFGGSTAGQAAAVPTTSLLLLCFGVLAVAGAGVVEGLWWRLPLVLAGAVLLLLVRRVDARQRVPILPHAALARPGAARAGMAMVVLLSIATCAFLIYGPLLMIAFHGIGALVAGYVVAFESVAWTLAAIAVGRVRPEGEGLYLRLGAAIILCGTIGIAVFLPLDPYWLVLPWAGMQGAGFGLAYAFIVRRVVTACPPHERDHAAGAVATLQMLGYAIGAALAGVVANGLGLGLAVERDALLLVTRGLFLSFVPIGLLGLWAAFRLAASRRQVETERQNGKS